jgi:hypothetical protein
MIEIVKKTTTKVSDTTLECRLWLNGIRDKDYASPVGTKSANMFMMTESIYRYFSWQGQRHQMFSHLLITLCTDLSQIPASIIWQQKSDNGCLVSPQIAPTEQPKPQIKEPTS